MLASKILIFFAIAIYSSWAVNISYDDIQPNLFSKQSRAFEFNVIESTRIVRKFFDREDVSLAIAAGTVLLELIPYIGMFAKLIPLARKTISDKSEWRTLFTKSVADETMGAITESEIRWIEASMKTIQDKIKLLGEDNPDHENRKTIASLILMDLDKMINFFDLKSSLFRKYPLVGAPPLIQLASLVAVFNPIANTLVPFEAKMQPISCKMLDVLLDFREIVVVARLHKIFTELPTFKHIVNVATLPYNPNGYDPGVIDCERNCTNRTLPHEICLKDKFGTDEFLLVKKRPKCLIDYAKLIRYRIENLIPIEVLNRSCGQREAKQPTGFGYLTITVLQILTYFEANGKRCKVTKEFCNSFVKLFINDDLVIQTPIRLQRKNYDPRITYTTRKIERNSTTIKIEVWDAGSEYFESDALIQETHGDIDSFFEEPIRKGAKFDELLRNRIETMSFWRDEYE